MSSYAKLNELFLFTYSTKHLQKKDKIRFYYSLKGRDGKSGIVAKYDIEHLGRTVLLVPSQFASDVKQFLELWGCTFKVRQVYIKNG